MGRLGFILALLTLVGCKTSEDVIGTGPLVVSERITKFYREEYLKKPGPWSFVISRDGRTAHYAYCAEGINGCQGSTLLFRILQLCEERAGAPCYLLDENGYVVWEGPVTFGDGTTAGTWSDDDGVAARDPVSAKRIVYTRRIVHKPMPPLPEPHELDDPRLCQMSMFRRSGTPAWREARSVQKHIDEARRRGLTLAACDQLVAG